MRLRRRRRSLTNAVVVITGASSGIGRASAVAFAARRARVVLAARRGEALHETAELCERQGAQVLVAITDVTKPEELERLVELTLRHWGRIDVWVNNAGTTLFGRLDEGEFDAHRQVLETNLVAPMYAARLVVPIFKRQGTGVLINLGSVLSQVGQAFVPSYAISKFGIRGLSEALRSDIADIPDVHACTLLPYAVDTPHFEVGGNAMGRRAYAMPFVQSPGQIADAVVSLAQRPRRQRYVPRYIAAGLAAHALMPRTAERLLRHALEAFHLVGRQPRTQGSMFEPQRRLGSVRGSRPPIIGRLAFTAWVLGDLGRMGLAWWRGRRA